MLCADTGTKSKYLFIINHIITAGHSMGLGAAASLVGSIASYLAPVFCWENGRLPKGTHTKLSKPKDKKITTLNLTILPRRKKKWVGLGHDGEVAGGDLSSVWNDHPELLALELYFLNLSGP